MKKGVLFAALICLAAAPATRADGAQDLDYLERIAESEPVAALALAAQLWPGALDELSQARILNAEATAFTITNEFAKALARARQAEAIAERNGFRDPLAHALLNQASVHRRQSRYELGYELGMRALKIFEATGNRRGQLLSANRVSTVLSELGDSEGGLEFNQRGLDLARQLQDSGEQARMLSNRAYFYYLKRDFRLMLQLSLQAIAIFEGINEESVIRHAMINAGVAHLELGDFREAERFLRRSIPISRRAHDDVQEMIALKFLARTHKNLGELPLARSEAMTALASGRRLANRFEVRNICVELADISARLNDHRAAYAHLAEALALQQELEAGGTREKITRSLKQYEIERQESRIRLLQQAATIAELQARQQRLQKNFLLGIAVVLLSAVFFITTAFLAKRKANRAITALNNELQEVDRLVMDINREFDLPSLIDSIFRQTLKLLPQTERGGFLYVSEDEEVFRPVTYYGYTPEEALQLSLPAMDAARRYKLSAQTMAPGIHLLRDPENACGAEAIRRLSPLPKAILALDLEVAGRTMGYLLFENMRRADAFNGPDIGRLVRVREHLISAIAKAHSLDRLQKVARVDPLTGLLNRRGMQDMLEQEIERFQRYGAPFAIALADLDGFARINELHGRESGDLALHHVAEIFKAKMRKVDGVARWDGQQFLALMPQTTAPHAVAAAEKVAAEVRRERLRIRGQALGLTLTLAVSEFVKGMTLEDLLAGALEALRAGKSLGRDRVIVVPGVPRPPGDRPGENA
jgi:diguanylate cyclase (GGDEF)-like protein